MMAGIALALLVAWLVLVAGLRSYVFYRRAGKMAAPTRVAAWSPQWWARLISSLGIVFAFTGPLAELAGLAPFAVLDHTLVKSTGLVLAVVGIAVTLSAQAAMGDAGGQPSTRMHAPRW